jgi:hypothetical protein
MASNPAATASASATTTSAIPDPNTERIAVLERVVVKDYISKVSFPKCDTSAFDTFEDQVYAALVSRQLEWIMRDRFPSHDAAVQRILRAVLLNSLSMTDRVRLQSIDNFTEMFKRLRLEATRRDRQKVDAYVADLFNTTQGAESLLEFVTSKQDIFARIVRARYPVTELQAVDTTLRKLRSEFMSFADEGLDPVQGFTNFDNLIARAERLQSLADNASPVASALEARIAVLEAQLEGQRRSQAHQDHQAQQRSPNSGSPDHQAPQRFTNSSHSRSGHTHHRSNYKQRRVQANVRRGNGEKPPNPCKRCGGDHWRVDCPKRDDQQIDGTPHIVSSCELQPMGELLAVDATKEFPSETVYLDSGASHSFTPHAHLLHDYRSVQGMACRYAGREAGGNVLGVGALILRARNGRSLQIQNVYHIASLRHTLLGVLKCARSGVYTHFDSSKGTGAVTIGSMFFTCWIEDTANGLPALDVSIVKPSNPTFVPDQAAHTAQATLPTTGLWAPELNSVQLGDVWHRRLLHPSNQAMKNLARLGLLPKHAAPPDFCEPCVMEKLHRVPRQSPLTLSPPTSADTKSAVPDVLIMEIRKLQSVLAPHQVPAVAYLRTDNSGEFIADRLANALQCAGITPQRTPAYAPQSNGAAKRSHRAIFERVRACLVDTGLPHYIWGELAFAAVYVLNRTPLAGVPGRGIPLEAFTGERVESLDHLRAVGARCYVLDTHGPKLDPRGILGQLVSYASSGRGTNAACRILLDSFPPRVITAVDVVFDERAKAHVSTPLEETTPAEHVHSVPTPIGPAAMAPVPVPTPAAPPASVQTHPPVAPPSAADELATTADKLASAPSGRATPERLRMH